MRVCERNNALGGDIEGHDGDILRWNGFWSGSSGRSRCGVEHLIERNYAVRKLAAEAADEANGEDLRRNVDDDLAVIDGADAADDDESARRQPAKRANRVGLPPQ